jgi:hypothetical protein
MGFSWAIKLIKSPVFTIIGLFVVAGLAISGKRVDFRRGALFVEVGAGTGGLLWVRPSIPRVAILTRMEMCAMTWQGTRPTIRVLSPRWENGVFTSRMSLSVPFLPGPQAGNGMRSTTGAAAIRLKNMLTLTTAHGLGGRARTRFRQASVEFGVFVRLIRNEIL